MRSLPRLPALAGFLLLASGAGADALVAREGRQEGTQAEETRTGPQPAPRTGESLQVLLVTLGQGDAVWERFGHNALWIRDRETGEGAAYNWGIFSFLQEGFILRLIRGTMLYSMAPTDAMAMMEEARRRDRRVWVQELDLTPHQKLELLGFVRWNALPENREYRYDYYRDNCSTRVRDALDGVLAGALKEAWGGEPTSYSYRWHTRRILGDRPLPYLGIQFVLGPHADHPIMAWQEMFLPLKLRDRVRTVEIPDGEGGTRPLLLSETAFTESGRPPVPRGPPPAFPWFLLAALLWGGAMVASAGPARTGGWLRRLPVTLLAGGWALTAAVGGSLLLGAWLFTDHYFWYRNMNLLQVSSLWLPIPLPFLLFLVRGDFPRWGRDMVVALLVVSLVGWGMQLLPDLTQRNGEILLFTLPMNVALWITARRLMGRPHTLAPPGAASGPPDPGSGEAPRG